MRFMMLMIPKGYETAAPSTVLDDVKRVTAMMKYTEDLQKAGVLLALDGLPSALDGDTRLVLRRHAQGDRRALRGDQRGAR